MSDNKTLERSKRAIRQAFWASKGMSLPDTSGDRYINYAESVEANLFRRHRDEVARFSAAMSGDVLRFEALSYFELWEDWQRNPLPDWLPQHVKNLLARYAVEI
ncbi:protein of unknown function [Nitrospira defluvii]|jgi:hypothetical protein|uniref:Uncharacterized protein n=1 Tax=Nitrospira defluvii TaxID=330214 RepID=D8PGD7_9BACT|nr:protein of unknown function [Nitrospira defluvii]